MTNRLAVVRRETAETNISLELALDGSGIWETNTGIRIFDHLSIPALTPLEITKVVKPMITNRQKMISGGLPTKLLNIASEDCHVIFPLKLPPTVL